MGFALSNMKLSSPAFEEGMAIPKKYTGDGEDVSPVIAWSGAPAETRSFAVICHDPDAPLVKHGTYGFVHWVLYNLPSSVTLLAEGSSEGTAGGNDFGNSGYNGPMPPRGHGRHHYFFWVLALDKQLNLSAGLTLWEFLAEAEPHIIAMNRLMGTYQR